MDFENWIVRDWNSPKESKYQNVFESIGLSTNFEDWLIDRNDFSQLEYADAFIDEVGSELTTPASYLSAAVQYIDEMIKRDLRFWLCEKDARLKFTSLLLGIVGSKRKLDCDNSMITHEKYRKKEGF